MPFKDYIKELLDTVTDIDHDISVFSSHHNLDTCGTDVVLPVLVQALKLNNMYWKKLCMTVEVTTWKLILCHNCTMLKQLNQEKKFAAVKKRLFSLDKMVDKSSANPGKSLCFGDNKVNGT